MNEQVENLNSEILEAAPVEESRSRAENNAGKGRKSFSLSWVNPWFVLALLAFALAGWQWIETRSKLKEVRQELARRLSENDAVVKANQELSRVTQEKVTALSGRISEIENQLSESKNQHAVLEALYQKLSSNRDEWSLAEIEQSVTLAAQQLQLSRNVQGAVLALQVAESRLADNTRPQFIGLRKILLRDLEKLRALPQTDISGMSMRLESVLVAVDSFRLATQAMPRNEIAPAMENKPEDSHPITSLAFWQHLASDFWGEIRNLVRIQRFDREELALLAPGQPFFLRENLKLRLLNARLALLANEQHIFRNELVQAQLWMNRYLDKEDKSVQVALTTIKLLLSAEMNIELPNLNDSLTAIKTFNLGKGTK